MIRIGLSDRQKCKEVERHLQEHPEIKKIFCFYFKDYPLSLKTGVEVEHIEYSNIIKYKYFYRLLEEIDESGLIVINECMRTQKRSDLAYNCAHHYLNQTPHRIIFEFFPIIDSKDDFMILLDFENKGKYKGKSFDYVYLQTEDVKVKPFPVRIKALPVEASEVDRKRYEKKKQQLFDSLGNKDPDNIPRALQLLAGDLKKKAIDSGKLYVARNKRFKLPNVYSYGEITGPGKYILIDTHFRRLNFNDFLKSTKMNVISYLSTTLPIDTAILNEFATWKARLDAIYAQASIYQ